jgi:single-strand DNA-binding protein
MPSLNRVQIIGRLGKDPEEKILQSGRTLVVFSVAVDRLWKSRNGESRKETDWFNVEAWGKLGEICLKYLNKGKLVYLEGRLRTSRYEHEGETRYATKVVADRMQMLDRHEKESGEPAEADIENENSEEEE